MSPSHDLQAIAVELSEEFGQEAVDLPGDDPVYCYECRIWVHPSAAWKCVCGNSVWAGCYRGTCKHCGGHVTVLRRGNRRQAIKCTCQLTPEERARWERLQAESERRNRRMEADELMAANRAKERRDATACWNERARRCGVKIDAPNFIYCLRCPKFDNNGEQKPRRKRKEAE